MYIGKNTHIIAAWKYVEGLLEMYTVYYLEMSILQQTTIMIEGFRCLVGGEVINYISKGSPRIATIRFYYKSVRIPKSHGRSYEEEYTHTNNNLCRMESEIWFGDDVCWEFIWATKYIYTPREGVGKNSPWSSITLLGCQHKIRTSACIKYFWQISHVVVGVFHRQYYIILERLCYILIPICIWCYTYTTEQRVQYTGHERLATGIGGSQVDGYVWIVIIIRVHVHHITVILYEQNTPHYSHTLWAKYTTLQS